jgi:3-carboxy-cis,cis-muconate cycloisomerase
MTGKNKTPKPIPRSSGEGGLFGDVFSTREMREVFDDAGLVQSWLDVERALAEAQADVGLIPKDVAAAIATECDVEKFDLVELRQLREVADHPLVPTVWALADHCPPEVGGYVHWGATTQDIMDTGTVLQIRAGLAILESRLWKLTEAVARQVHEHRGTLMAGRTHGQHAVPITFGFKAASWLFEAMTDLERLSGIRQRVLVVQFAGASGTLASLGADGAAVRSALAKRLALGERPISWHSSRDALVDTVAWIGLVAGLCERIAQEVIALQRTEISEVEEAQPAGKVGSSTMPQKRNPMTAEGIVATARMARAMIAPAFEILVGEHERDMSTWESEWDLLPRAFERVDGALRRTVWLVETLRVDPVAMRRNLDGTGGLIAAEAVMMRLAHDMGRQRAHDLIHSIATASVERQVAFRDLLVADDQVLSALGADGIAAALDPTRYLGTAVDDADAVLAEYRHRSQLRLAQGEGVSS